ncbi:hypothetical protein [Ralstonia solanacearum]|uniref:hypothetical protein n=1 Tax=Ralstonia solanacearum TaxID=305 RepID=UPI003D68437A
MILEIPVTDATGAPLQTSRMKHAGTPSTHSARAKPDSTRERVHGMKGNHRGIHIDAEPELVSACGASSRSPGRAVTRISEHKHYIKTGSLRQQFS